MAFVHGKTGYFQLDSSAGTLVDLSPYISDVGFPREVSADETTTFGATDKSYIVGLGDQKFSLSGKFDPTLDAHMAGVLAAHKANTLASASFVYGPQGSTASNIKFTGESILTSYEVSQKVDGVIEWKAEAQVTGSVTRTTF